MNGKRIGGTALLAVTIVGPAVGAMNPPTLADEGRTLEVPDGYELTALCRFGGEFLSSDCRGKSTRLAAFAPADPELRRDLQRGVAEWEQL